MIKPSIPKGTRDFGPEELYKREYIFNTIRQTFQKYGFQPIETPAMENLATLTGKYGEEGDKLLFKILDNGDFLAKADEKALTEKDSARLASSITGKGLRYDLTIPFARFVVMNQHNLNFPFKRYQIQPVWRADRPQKGRYREFYQCDADVVGSDSLLNEVELVQIYDEVFSTLGVSVTIRINNRKILYGLAEVAGIPDRLVDLTMAIDKLDKIGFEGVTDELTRRGIDTAVIKPLTDIVDVGTDAKLDYLKKHLAGSEKGMLGIQEAETVFNLLKNTDLLGAHVELDITLARGLDYYTGTIFEVAARDAQMGSIGGGGRYDDLTGVFGLKGVSGVGISFGAERIYDIMEELGLFDEKALMAGPTAFFINFGGVSETAAFKHLQQLRKAGIPAELYPSPDKFNKQMKYADQKKARFVVFVGEEEIAAEKLKIKEMETGEQNLLTMDQLIQRLQTG